jgi:hypothetical protein
MFVLSQYLLNASGMCKTQQILSYSIALGLILYSSIYLYLLFYNNEYLSIFNKFIIYIVVVDLLLSAFYYFNLQEKDEPPRLDINDTEDGEEDEEDEEDEDDEESEVEYIGSEEEEDEEEPQLDSDSQKYIDNLIAQARLSDQQRMSAFMQKHENEDEDEQEKEEQLEAPELVSTHQETLDDNDSKDDTVSQQIESIIDEVVAKKKPTKRNQKKKSPVASPMEL